MKSLCQVILILTLASSHLVAQRQNTSLNKSNSFTNPGIMVGANLLWPGGGLGYNLTGNGISVALWEAGNDFNANTMGFSGRLTNQETSGISSHATHVARLLALNADSGIAYHSSLSVFGLGTSVPGWANEMGSEAQLKLFIANLSYANGGGWISSTDSNWYGVDNISLVEDYKFGYYDHEARVLDSLVNEHPYFLPIKAVGNSKGITLSDTTGNFTAWHFDTTSEIWSQQTYSDSFPKANGIDGFDCLPGNSTGKNYLVVGSCADIGTRYSSPVDVTLSSLSSTGPTDDGRIKPDIVAPTAGGLTSYAAPVVSGSIALIQEHYYSKTGSFLNASSVRGIICHTASEAGAQDGPDYQMGWGLLNTEACVDFFENTNNQLIETSLDPNDSIVISFYSDGVNPTKITLVWNDPKGTTPELTYTSADLDNSTSILINDLDLRIYNASDHSTVFQPWTLDLANPSNPASKGDNTRDNIEVVDAGVLSTGWHKIKVTHKGSMSSSQNLTLIAEGITTVTFENNSWSLSPSSWTGKEWVRILDTENSATLTGNYSAGRMEISPKAELVISGGTLTVKNGLVIHADSTGYGQFNGNVSGNVYDQFFFEGTDDYRHFSTPINTNFQDWLGDDLTRALDQNASTPSIWTFDNANSEWSAADLTQNAINTPIAVFSGDNSGYEFSKLPLTIDAMGSFNYQNTPLTLTADDDNDGANSDLGWNFIGNPFTANLQWSSVMADNTGVTNGSYYVWDSENQQYATSNGAVHTLNANGVIAKNQAVFLYLPNSSGTTLNINTSAITLDSTSLLKSSPAHITLTANYQQKIDQAVIVFESNASKEYVVLEDAIKKIYDHEFYLSTESNSKDHLLSIDKRPLDEDCIIPIKIGNPLGPITLSIETNGLLTQSFYLTDGMIGDSLLENKGYDLSMYDLQNLRLIIKSPKNPSSSLKSKIWYHNEKVFFPKTLLSSIQIIDGNGRVVFQKKHPISPLDISKLKSGTYLVNFPDGFSQRINHIR